MTSLRDYLTKAEINLLFKAIPIRSLEEDPIIKRKKPLLSEDEIWTQDLTQESRRN